MHTHKRFRCCAFTLLFSLVVFSSPVGAAEADIVPLVRELTGQAAPIQRTLQQWEAVFGQVIEALISASSFAEAQPQPRPRAPKAILDDIILRAAGQAAQRAPLAGAMLACLQKAEGRNERVFLLRQLAIVGRAEAVPAIAKLLIDVDPVVREYALRALEANSSPAAGKALVAALGNASDPAQRMAIVDTLGRRREGSGASSLARLLSDQDEKVAAAAAMALGSIGSDEAAKALAATQEKDSDKLASVLLHARLLCADRQAGQGHNDAARAIYKDLCAASKEPFMHGAVLRGLVLTRPEQSLPLLLEALRSDNRHVQAQAAQLTLEIPGEEAAKALRAAMPELPPSAQALLAESLDERGGRRTNRAPSPRK